MSVTTNTKKPTNTFAILSAVFAFLSIPGSWCCAGYVTGLISVVCGLVALSQFRQSEFNTASKVAAWGGIGVSLATLAVGAIFSLLTFGLDNVESPIKSFASAQSYTLVELPELLNEYETNPVQADEKFKGKWISFSGTVEKIQPKENRLFLGTAHSGQTLRVQCQFATGTDLGLGLLMTEVGVRGKVVGLNEHVVLTECKLK